MADGPQNPLRWKPSKARPARRSGISWREHNGQLVAQSAPKSSAQGYLPEAKAWAEFFKRVQQQFPFLHPIEHNGWTATAVKGRLYPRDLYTAAAFGRSFGITTPDGRTIMPARSLFDLSRTLDIFDDRPGSVLFRGKRLWNSTGPEQAGRVLTLHDTEPYVRWSPPPPSPGTEGKLFILNPINPPTDWSGTLNSDRRDHPGGGYHIGVWATTTAEQHILGTWPLTWSGETVCIGIHPAMHLSAQSLIQFGVKRPTVDELYGIAIIHNSSWSFNICGNSASLLNAQGSVFATGSNFNTEPIFLGLRKSGTELILSWGSWPTLMRDVSFISLGVNHALYTTLGLRIRVGSSSTNHAQFRLCHGLATVV